MRVTFWGTRGSVATPGVSTLKYGGNTSCVQLTTDKGTLLILDCGTGVRILGEELLAACTEPIRGHIFLTHTHWDHIQGFPFFAPAFIQGNEWMIYGPADGEKQLEQALAGQMQYTYFPVELENISSSLVCSNISEGEFRLDDVLVWSQFLNHPAVTLGYRFEVGRATVAYCTDHEPYSIPLFKQDTRVPAMHALIHAGDRRHAEFLSGVDLLIHDAQYTADEYESKRNWGHSPIDYVVEIALIAGVKRLALFHHDPKHDDDQLDALQAEAAQKVRDIGANMEVFFAREGSSLELEEGPGLINLDDGLPHNMVAPATARVLVVDDEPAICDLVSEILDDDNYDVTVAGSGGLALSAISRQIPDLVLLDMRLPDIDGFDILKRLRSEDRTMQLPVIMLTASDDPESAERGFEAGATDYMTKPFSPSQLRARVSSWLQRSARGAGHTGSQR